MAPIFGLNQHVAALFASTGGFAVGVTLGWNSQAGLALRSAMGWDPLNVDIVMGTIGTGAGAGAILGPLLYWYVFPAGCRSSIGYISLPFLAFGWILICKANYSFNYIMWGRMLCGIGTGAITLLAPLYIAEIGSPNRRVMMLLYFHLMLSCGIACSYIIAWATTDNETLVFDLDKYSISCALANLLSVFALLVPPSPVAMMKSKKENQEKTFRVAKSLGWDSDEQMLQRETQRMRDIIWTEDNQTRLQLHHPKFWQSFLQALFVMWCQQLGGAYPLIFNLVTLLDVTYMGSLTSQELSLYCGGLLVFSSLLAVVLTFLNFERRTLLVLSAALMGACMLLLGSFIYYRDQDEKLEEYSAVVPTIIIIYYGAFGFGLAGSSWSLLADTFPINLRIFAMSLVGILFWFLCMFLNNVLSGLLLYFGVPQVFWLFSAVSFFTTMVSCCIQSNSGKSLADVHDEFQIR